VAFKKYRANASKLFKSEGLVRYKIKQQAKKNPKGMKYFTPLGLLLQKKSTLFLI